MSSRVVDLFAAADHTLHHSLMEIQNAGRCLERADGRHSPLDCREKADMQQILLRLAALTRHVEHRWKAENGLNERRHVSA